MLTVTDKSVAVGAQVGTLSVGKAGTVTFPVTTTGIADGTYSGIVSNMPPGVSVRGQVAISDGHGTLTLAGDDSTVAGVVSSLTLAIDGATSAAFTLSISEPDTSASGMDNFASSRTYTPGQFVDVNENAWYGFNQQKAVALAYSYELMHGTTTTPPMRFSPTANYTIAQALTVAARVHSIYTTGDASGLVEGTPWHQVYVDYCIANGIISANTFAMYGSAATRAEMAYIFSRALPASEFATQNTVNSLPDVTNSTPYADAITTLYRAGVIQGDTGTGAFRPSSTVSRAEAAAIISRVILPDIRFSGLIFG